MLEQDAEPFGMIQRGRRIGRQFLEASGAAFQSEVVQQVQGRVCQHDQDLNGK